MRICGIKAVCAYVCDCMYVRMCTYQNITLCMLMCDSMGPCVHRYEDVQHWRQACESVCVEIQAQGTGREEGRRPDSERALMSVVRNLNNMLEAVGCPLWV